MIYDDAVYESIDITEPVLLDLLNSSAVQRLQKILQHGISGWLGITGRITRFDHSVGTMLLVRRLGAPLQEQIAALLHDVSHTVWSHVIDYVMEQPHGLSYHEVQKEAYVARTEIPSILARHDYDWHDILEDERFPLLEQPAPALCADRLDYFFRDSLGLNLITQKDIDRVLSYLSVHNGRIIVTDVDVAHWLATTYMAMDQASWANFREIGLYNLMAEVIRIGLKENIIEEIDFWKTDEVVWRKLKKSNHQMLCRYIKLLSKDTHFIRDDTSPTFCVQVKLRTIDPDILIDDRLLLLSSIDEVFARERKDYLSTGVEPWPICVVGKI